METDDLKAIAAQLLKLESQVGRLKRTVESFGDATKIQNGDRLEELLDPNRKCDPAPHRIVVAEEFILVDGNGRARARLAMEDGDRPILSLLNKDGGRSNFFTLTDAGGVLHLSNKKGEEIILSVGSNQDDNDKVVSILLVDRDGFHTRIGREHPMNTRGKRGDSAASVALTDKDGKVLWSAP